MADKKGPGGVNGSNNYDFDDNDLGGEADVTRKDRGPVLKP